MAQTAYAAERIFDGDRWHEDAVLLVEGGRISGIRSGAPVADAVDLPGWIVPGLVDLQVNGGGGTLFNNDPTVAGIARICAAHARLGTTATMVTLITDRPAVMAEAIAAAEGAVAVPGFAGLHLEGPHLALSRKGTHDPALIRAMDDDDLAALIAAAARLPRLICTLAPESVRPDQVAALAAAGVTVSLGHSDCDHATARAYAQAGARMVTHVYNAMSQLQHRAPGLVGAALDEGGLSAGLIADGFHVDEAALRIALRSKAATRRLFLVSDAMATVGSDLDGFFLNGRRIYRGEGRLTLADGTLAGADIALVDAVRHLHLVTGWPLGESLRLAALYPAEVMGFADRGHLRSGARADFLCLTPDLRPVAGFVGGAGVAA